MNLPDHLLQELADLGRLVAKQFQLVENSATTNDQNFQETHRKLDEWIQTNRAISESNRNLLKLITTNAEALVDLTTSYNSNVSSWQDLRQQLRHFEQTMNDWSSSLSPEGEATEMNNWIEEQEGKLIQLIQQLELTVKAVQLQSQQSSVKSEARALGQVARRPTGLGLSVDLVRRATAPLAALGCLLMAAGSGVGFAFAQTQHPIPLYVTDTQKPLTLDEANLLAWVRSDEGQLAKNMMDWNSGMIDALACTQEVKRLGVTLKIQGRPATYGFCTLWVVPPKQRQFED